MNPVALVTGASRGIGRGIALELAAVGYDLVVNYAGNLPAATQTAADCTASGRDAGHKIRVEPCQADISQSSDRRKLIDFARAQFGRLDLLVNNAGVAPSVRADLLQGSEAEFDRAISINLKGPYFLTQLAANWMIELPEEGVTTSPLIARYGKPKIVTISSISAYTASTNRGEYCVAKAGLGMLTKLYATRLAEHGILVYEVRPGIIATDMTRPVKDKYDNLISQGLTPIRSWGTPGHVGKAVAAIAQNAFPFSTGEVINVDGGFHVRQL